jgi:Flp pilus assembly pilin Flp
VEISERRGWRGADDEEADMRRFLRRLRDDSGMATAEYAVGTIAAVAFAAILYKVITSGSVMTALGAIIRTALQVHL